MVGETRMKERNLRIFMKTYRRQIGGLAMLVALSGAAAGAVAYAQSIDGPVGDLVAQRPAPAPAQGLEEFAEELKTRERLLARRDQFDGDLTSAEERVLARLEELQKLREQVSAQLLELQTLRRETAAQLAELQVRRQTEQAVLDSWRQEQLADIEVKRKQALAELEFHRKDAAKVIEEKRAEIMKEVTAENDEDTLGLIQMVESMKAKDAAAVLSEVNEDLAVRVLEGMTRTKAGKAMAEMTPVKAASLAEKMADPPTYEKLGLPEPAELLGDPAASMGQAGAGTPPPTTVPRQVSPVKPASTATPPVQGAPPATSPVAAPPDGTSPPPAETPPAPPATPAEPAATTQPGGTP